MDPSSPDAPYNPASPYDGVPHEDFEIDTLSASDFYHFTRFDFDDLKRLSQLFQIPEVVYTQSGHAFDRLHAMFLLCTRLICAQTVSSTIFTVQRKVEETTIIS